jgi:hypothetical protein
MRPRLVPLLLLSVLAPLAQAGAEVDICFNYGCQTEARIRYSDPQLEAVGRLLAGAEDAGRERALLALVIGQLYGWAGEQSAIRNDRGGDYADDAAYGRMDCIDHAESTTRLLRLLETRGWLRFHRVQEVVRRSRFVLDQHFSAVVEEIEAPASALPAAPAPLAAAMPPAANLSAGPRARFVVDSWYYDNGMAAVVLPLDQWLEGAGPDV